MTSPDRPRAGDGASARCRRSGDAGSTIPLILGMFIIAFLVVAGAVAAGDAFVQHRALQGICDGAAAAAASSADPDQARTTASTERYLRLGAVEDAVHAYLGRDPARASITATPAVSADGSVVTLRCTRVATIAFGAVFGRGSGITLDVQSRARAPITA